MTLDEFRQSAAGPSAAPPPGLGGAVQALWFDARGEWEKAHERAQDDRTRSGSWVHAYLHRKEGDSGNADYWYARAGRPPARGPLADEWESIATELLK